MGDEPANAEPHLPPPNSITYIQLPADEVERAAAFYAAVFGWTIRRNDEHVSFEDAGGHVSGAWEPGREPSRTPGILPYVYVDDVDTAVASILAHGGDIVRQPHAEGGLRVATFRDPEGNVLGIWQVT